jgi:hypothetical protein
MGAEKWGEVRAGLAEAEGIQQKQTKEAEIFGSRIPPTARRATRAGSAAGGTAVRSGSKRNWIRPLASAFSPLIGPT